MSAHRILRDLFLDAAPYDITDPGDTKTLIVDRQLALCKFTSSSSAETRTLAQPTKPGMLCALVMDVDGGGDITLTVTGGYNQAASTSLVFGDAGDWVLFYSVEVGTAYYWRVIASEGVNVTRTDLSVTTLTATDSRLAVTALNAAGSGIGNAAALSPGINIVGAANNTTCVQLPVAVAGMEVWVRSTVGGKTLPVFPQSGSQIDALGANNAFTMPSGALGPKCIFKASNATQWWSWPCDNT